MPHAVQTTRKTILADLHQPVALYLKLRETFPETCLLENSDHKSDKSTASYIGVGAVGGFALRDDRLTITYPGQTTDHIKLNARADAIGHFKTFINAFQSEADTLAAAFGYTGYSAMDAIDTITLTKHRARDDIDDMRYRIFAVVIRYDSDRKEITLEEHQYYEGQKSLLDEVLNVINTAAIPALTFARQGAEYAYCTDEDYMVMVARGTEYCQAGDVFQVVPSRRFRQGYTGDAFQVYRALRAMNPSPYMFYMDCGDYVLLGSSPEAQVKVAPHIETAAQIKVAPKTAADTLRAHIFPIAGTFPRSGNYEEDLARAKALFHDKKEHAEHTMLVDLARNDLSRYCHDVTVNTAYDIEFYSHVIHMVSHVSGTLTNRADWLDVMFASFPAGTLSGAPKYRAMQIIDELETTIQRGWYAGMLGFIGFNQTIVKAIMIRSLLAQNEQLHYQGGGGVVVASNPATERDEVYHKLAAARRAMALAETL